jgi:P27 family predicted phage terminase small subunit
MQKYLAGYGPKPKSNGTAPEATLERVPPAPDTLGADGRKLWKALYRPLIEAGVMVPDDRYALELLCGYYDIWRAAQRSINEQGVLIDGQRGLVKNPALQIAREAGHGLRAMLAEFGLTPQSARLLGLEGD